MRARRASSVAVGVLDVQLEGLEDLGADAVHRVERVHGALEHDRGLAPAQRPQLAPGQVEDVAAVHQHPAGDGRRAREQPQHGHGQRRLARPDSPAMPSDPPAGTVRETSLTASTVPRSPPER